MFKTVTKQRLLLFCSVFVAFLFAIIQAPVVHAATQQTQIALATPSVSLSQAGQTDPAHAVGHPGTMVTITIQSFTAGTAGSSINLYTTTDPGQCMANGSGLQPFTGYTTVTTDAAGNKVLSNIPWPSNANQPTSVYYICAISVNPTGMQAVSTQSFTVAQNVTITASSPTVQPGGQVTITGANWVPSQQVTVAIAPNRASGQNNVLAQGMVTSDNGGNFSINLVIPANATPGSYALSAVATNEPTMQFEQDNLITVNATVPTPTPSPSPTPSATPSPTPSPTTTATPSASSSNGGGGGGGLTVLIFTLGGLGILLIVIGVIMFAASSPTAAVR